MPLDRMQPRSLLVPPGIPEFMTRERTVAAGEVLRRGPRLVGPRAGRVGRGQRRRRLDLGSGRARAGRRAVGLARLVFRWDAQPGEHVLCSRARDEAGNEQPVEPPWNLGGYANNAVQTVRVTVTP